MKKILLLIALLIITLYTYSQNGGVMVLTELKSDTTSHDLNQKDGNYHTTASHGTLFMVTAIPNPGWKFDSWVENDTITSTENPYDFTVYSHRYFVVNFSKIQILVQIIGHGDGNTFGHGTYDWGDEVTVSAEPLFGYTFQHWMVGDDIVSENQIYSFTAEEDVVLHAYFTIKTYNINIFVNPNGSGTVTGEGSYKHGDDVSLHGIPNDSWNFKSYELNGNMIYNNPYQFQIYENIDITANFESSNSVGEQYKNLVSVHPNPTKDYLKINADDLKQIVVMTSGGVYVESIINIDNNTINLSHLPMGVYILQLYVGDNIVPLKVILM